MFDNFVISVCSKLLLNEFKIKSEMLSIRYSG